MSADNTWGLMVSFEDQSPSYAYGFEAGMLWMRITSGAEAEIEAVIRQENMVTAQRMATSRGFDMKAEDAGNGWRQLTLTKTAAMVARPNPYGLRLVKNDEGRT